MRLNKKHNQDGFTLIETIVAIVIITVGLLMLAHLMTVGIVLNERTEAGLKSIQLAQGKLESLKAQFNNFMNSGELPGDLSSGSHGPETVMIQTDDSDTQNYLSFDLSWDITDLSGGMKQVTLSVNPDGDDNQSVVTITSVLAP